MWMRRTLVVLGAALVVTAAAVVPAWLSAPASPDPEPRATAMPAQLAGVQWDECTIENAVPEGITAFTVDRDGRDVGVHVQAPDGHTLSAAQVEADPAVREFVAGLQACLGRYPVSYETGPAQLDLAERAMYYDYVAGTAPPRPHDLVPPGARPRRDRPR